MSINSKEALLKKLGEGSAVHEWGAILALGRDTVNTLLEAKFVERLSEMDYIQPITETYYANEDRTERVAFEALMFGPPTLSFEHASGKSNRVRVRMELIAGRCARWSMFPGEAKYLRDSHQLSQGLGYWLAFTAELVVIPVEGSGGRQLQLGLDMINATDPNCSLGRGATDRMGRFMLEQLRQQPIFAQPYTFYTMAPTAQDVFTVVEVTPITQKAPDGAGTGGMPETDGAILLLMQLHGSAQGGYIPGSMPYLLPRKVDDIAENMGTALLIGRLRALIGTGQAEQFLSQMVLPGGSTFAVDDERPLPHDMICFGELKPNSRGAWLSPALSSIAAGEGVEFKSNGGPLFGWQANGFNSPRTAGTISEQGVYRARPIGEFGSTQRLTVVTAKVSEEADSATRAALVIEAAEPLTISPRVVTWYPDYEDVVLRVSGGSGVTWKALGEEMGELKPDPEDARQATFKPTRQNTPFVRLQRIEVSDGENRGHATIVLLGVGHKLDIEPLPVPRLLPNGAQPFSLVGEEADKWQLFGPGQIDAETGVYTAPAQTNEEVSVVVGFAGPFAGAAVVEHRTPAPAPAEALALEERWKTLKEFSLKRNNLARNQVFANGLQQVGIDIVIATHSFTNSVGEEVWDPVDELELRTLVLTDGNNNVIPYLTGDETGIPEDSNQTWMANKRRNKTIDYYPTTGPAETQRVFAEHEGRRTVTVYVHSREAETANFRATFQDHNRGWQKSMDIDDIKGEIQLEGMPLPEKSLKYFNWPAMGKRVASQGGEDYEGDRFNYWHSTTDYWELSGEGLSFVDVAFDSTSMVKWESEQIEETFGSYTGIAFKPRRPDEETDVPSGVNYQAELQLLVNEPEVKITGLEYGFHGQEEPTAGAILVTLDRSSGLTFWDDYRDTSYRKVLTNPIKFTVTDNYGNKHKLRLLFSGELNPRNYLELKLQ